MKKPETLAGQLSSAVNNAKVGTNMKEAIPPTISPALRLY